ncbi:MAG: DUF3291 domain-containing protein [Bacteroidota bacterium]
MSDQITTLTLFKYPTLRGKIWAFGMMQFAHRQLQGIEGMTFYKLVGSGKGLGFNPFPDWSVYGLLQVWNSDKAARQFFGSSPLIKNYNKKTSERATLFMRNISAHGQWSGQTPFKTSTLLDPANPYRAIITRATIKASKLWRFWSYVPTSQKPIKNAEGLIYTKGIGEIPIKQMATFSVWESEDDMKKFAYQSKEHQKAIRMTRELNWYAEELFARFQPYDFMGSWEGKSWDFSTSGKSNKS